MSSAWYRAGTVAVTQNSKTVTGSSTQFVAAAVRKGDVFIGPDREIYEIDTVNSNTSITLVSNYLGSNSSGAYAILRFMGNTVVSLASEIVDKTIKWEQLIDNIDDWLSTASGNVTLTDSTGGTYTIPSLPQLNANVNSSVKLTGNQTVAGLKTFSSNPRSSATQGTNATDLTRKDYVDNQRDTRVAKSGDTVTGTLTVNGTINGTAVTQSAIDTTAGRLLKVGDFGVGASSSTGISTANNTLFSFSTGSGVGIGYGAGFQSGYAANRRAQFYVDAASKAFFRWVPVTDLNPGGTTVPWREIYHTGNILGTVSQSGGVPTGAIIERGSNGDGEYVKYADGTLICIRTRVGISVTANQSFDYVWNFPHSFISPFSGTNVYAGIQDVSTTLVFTVTQLLVHAVSTVNQRATIRLTQSSSQEIGIHAIAIGRWY